MHSAHEATVCGFGAIAIGGEGGGGGDRGSDLPAGLHDSWIGGRSASAYQKTGNEDRRGLKGNHRHVSGGNSRDFAIPAQRGLAGLVAPPCSRCR